MDKIKETEIKDIVFWISGYVSVIEGHQRLKEEVLRLENLKSEQHSISEEIN